MTWTDIIGCVHNSYSYSILASDTPVLGYHVHRGDSSLLRPKRMNRGWVKPSMEVSNSLSVTGLGKGILTDRMINRT